MIEHDRNHDRLTGLLNRRALAEKLQQYDSNRQAIAVVMVDLDHFKEVNDTFGHAAGDIALKTATQIFQEVFDSKTLIARLGGDEFLIVSAFEQEAQNSFSEALNHMIHRVPICFEKECNSVSVTFSAGCCICERGHMYQLEDLMAETDKMMYQAKQQGRNRIILTNAGGHKEVLLGQQTPAQVVQL